MARVSSLSRAVQHLRLIHKFQAHTTHCLARVEDQRGKGRAHAAFVCKTCTASWVNVQALQADVAAQTDSDCKGKDDRCHRLRSSRNKGLWARNPASFQQQLRTVWRLTKKEEEPLTTKQKVFNKKFGKNKAQPKVSQGRRTKFQRQPQQLAKARKIGLELRNRKKNKLVEEGIEPNPGPSKLLIVTVNFGNCAAPMIF